MLGLILSVPDHCLSFYFLLMVFCMKLFNLNGNNEPLFLSFVMGYIFIGILFPYSSIHL